MKRTAHLSRCGTYRYELTRSWAPEQGRVCWIMLNPSTADAEQDDPTLRRCIHFTTAWGYGELVVVNLYPFRSPHPTDLWRWTQWEQRQDWPARDAQYYVNLPIVVARAKNAGLVAAAWGNGARDLAHVDHVLEKIQAGLEPWPDLHCLGTTSSGAPKHPMARGKHRVPDDQEPVLWRAA